MTPVVTPAEMRAIDEAAPVSLDVLIGRAASAVARHAIAMLGGTYGRTVTVIAGKGDNGADGRAAARLLERRGVRVRVVDVGSVPAVLPPADLVVDAALGTGYTHRPGGWSAPGAGGSRVLAVDIPSGIDGLTGEARGNVLAADETVTFQALKPGLLFADGARTAGRVHVVDIGLDAAGASCHRIDVDDVAAWWPRRPTDSHKWRGAVKVVAGSIEMPGAAALCTEAAMRAGSGLVSLSSPGAAPATIREVVQRHVAASGFASEALVDIDRFEALVIGPGMGRTDDAMSGIRSCIGQAPVPVVVDGDGLSAIADGLPGRTHPTVLTPHDGEFATLTGHRPEVDRIADVRATSARLGAVVLLKGPTSVIADPGGEVLLVDHGDERLATAGSGDVLSGIVGAALATGLEPLRAAACSAWLHADASRRAGRYGIVASDIVDSLPAAIEALG